MPRRWRWVGPVLAALCLVLAQAHVALVSPRPRSPDGGLKAAPCGTIAAGAPTVEWIAGEMVTLEWTETICHKGAPFRLALAAGTGDQVACFNTFVLVDHIPHDDACAAPHRYTYSFRVPLVDCPACVLQLVQVMTDKSQYKCDGTLPEHWQTYYSCADIAIRGNVSLSDYVHARQEPTGWPAPQLAYGLESARWDDGALASAPADFAYVAKAASLGGCSEPALACESLAAAIGHYCNDEHDSAQQRSLCVRWWLYGDTVRFEMQAQTRGWASIGFTPSTFMLSSDVYQVAFVDGVARVRDGHVPDDEYNVHEDARQDVFDVAGSLTEEGSDLFAQGPVLRVSFSRLLNTGDADDMSIDERGVRLIWAVRTLDADFTQKHNRHATEVTTLDILSNANNDVPRAAAFRTAHGVMMFFAWPLLASLGAITSRYLRRALPWWWQLHVGLQSAALLFNLIGFAIIVARVGDSGRRHWIDGHEIIGLVVFILACVQPALGALIAWQSRRAKEATDDRRPLFPNWVHVGVGAFLLVLVHVNPFLGLAKAHAGQGVTAVYATYFVILALSVIALELLRYRAVVALLPPSFVRRIPAALVDAHWREMRGAAVHATAPYKVNMMDNSTRDSIGSSDYAGAEQGNSTPTDKVEMEPVLTL